MPCLIVSICLGLSSKKYNIGVSSEAKYAVKPKKQSQGGLSGAIVLDIFRTILLELILSLSM